MALGRPVQRSHGTCLVVDFEVGALADDGVDVRLGLHLLDACKDVVEHARDQPRLLAQRVAAFVAAKHRVRLARTGLAVRENGRVESLQDGLAHRLPDSVEHVLLRALRSTNLIVLELPTRLPVSATFPTGLCRFYKICAGAIVVVKHWTGWARCLLLLSIALVAEQNAALLCVNLQSGSDSAPRDFARCNHPVVIRDSSHIFRIQWQAGIPRRRCGSAAAPSCFAASRAQRRGCLPPLTW
jgi:hypothetical protein